MKMGKQDEQGQTRSGFEKCDALQALIQNHGHLSQNCFELEELEIRVTF